MRKFAQIFTLITVAVLTTFNCIGQVSKGLSNYVDPFTGDFRYNVPLASLSGLNGESFPIGLTYKAGIRTNQEATWVGLGWHLNIGEITRQVNGIPDDWQEETFNEYSYNSSGDTTLEKSWDYFGPFHYRNFNYNSNDALMDVYQSTRHITDSYTPFEFPDYDGFMVSGPGIAGEMNMHLLDYATLVPQPKSENIQDEFHLGDFSDTTVYHRFTKRAQFRFRNEPGGNVKAPYYGKTSYDPNCNCYNTSTGNSYLELNDTNYNTHFQTPYQLDTVEDYDLGTGNISMPATNYIEYWTNQEIYDHYNYVNQSVGDSTNEIENFMDFEVVTDAGDRNDTTKYDVDGIGAFRITTPSGMVYHYSLPSYTWDDLTKVIPINNDWTVGNTYTEYIKTSKYASSWKLTAITNIDYIDANANGMVDQGDTGYWLTLSYTKWSSEFPWRAPYYGYSLDEQGQRRINPWRKQWNEVEFSKTGTITEAKSEVYYIDQIETATQTMFFIKDLRMDGHSIPDASSDLIPKLRIAKVVIIDNDDINSSWFNNTTRLPSMDFSVVSSLNNVVNIEQYELYQTAIEAVALQTADLHYSYDLAPNVYNNINNTATTDTVTIGGEAFVDIDSMTGGNGRLTLDSVNIFGYAYEQVVPGTQFEYKTVAEDNTTLEYHHRKKDFWGYYKHSFNPDHDGSFLTTNPYRGGYLTQADTADVDAWSLKKITTPLGGTIHIDYASDEYTGVGYDSESQMPAPVTRTFMISEVTGSGLPVDVNLRLFDADGYDLFDTTEVLHKSVYFEVQCSLLVHPFTKDSIGYGFSDRTFTGTIETDNNDYQYINVTREQVGSGSVYNVVYNWASCDTATSIIRELGGQPGYLRLHMSKAYGGGLRVASITAKEPESRAAYKLNANYESGIATAELDHYGMDVQQRLTANKYNGDRHALIPSVGYSRINFEYIGDDASSSGKTTYHFVNYFDSYKPLIHRVDKSTSAPWLYGTLSNRRWEIMKVTENNSTYGKLKGLTNFDTHGNVISYTKYNYGTYIDPQSRIDEVFFSQFGTDDPTYYTAGIQVNTVYLKSWQTSPLESIETYVDGLKTTKEILTRDELTGYPTLIKVNDPSDGEYTIERSHVFRGSPTGYDELGPKCVDPDNLNILLPMETEKLKRENVLIGGRHNVWSNSHDYRIFDNAVGENKFKNTSQADTFWAPVESYVFNGEASTADWKKVSDLTLLGANDIIFEQRDMKDFYVANKFGYDDRYKIAEVVNSNYASFTHCGFERTSDKDTSGTTQRYFDGEVSDPTGTSMRMASNGTVDAHTGDYLVKVPAGSSTPPAYNIDIDNAAGGIEKGIHRGRTYRVSVWIHEDSPSDAKLEVNLGGTSSETWSSSYSADESDAVLTVGDWQLLNLDVYIPADYASDTAPDFEVTLEAGVAAAGYFDDLRVHPVDASITSYIYDETRGLVLFSLDGDNIYTRYEYDASGSVIATYQETTLGEKKVSAVNYGFARPTN